MTLKIKMAAIPKWREGGWEPLYGGDLLMKLTVVNDFQISLVGTQTYSLFELSVESAIIGQS